MDPIGCSKENVRKCSCFYAVIPIDLDGSVGHHICGSLIHICTYICVVCVEPRVTTPPHQF